MSQWKVVSIDDSGPTRSFVLGRPGSPSQTVSAGGTSPSAGKSPLGDGAKTPSQAADDASERAFLRTPTRHESGSSGSSTAGNAYVASAHAYTPTTPSGATSVGGFGTPSTPQAVSRMDMQQSMVERQLRDALRLQLEQELEASARLKATVERMQRERGADEGDRSELHATIDRLTREAEHAEYRRTLQEERVAELTRHSSQLQTDRNEFERRALMAEREAAALEESRLLDETKVSSLERRNRALAMQVDDLVERETRLKEGMRRMEDSMKERALVAAAEEESRRSILADAEGEQGETIQRLQESLNAVSAIEAKHSFTIYRLEGRISEFQQREHEYQKAIEQLQHRNSRLTEQLADAEARARRDGGEVTQKRELVARLQTRLASTEDALRDRVSQVHHLRSLMSIRAPLPASAASSPRHAEPRNDGGAIRAPLAADLDTRLDEDHVPTPTLTNSGAPSETDGPTETDAPSAAHSDDEDERASMSMPVTEPDVPVSRGETSMSEEEESMDPSLLLQQSFPPPHQARSGSAPPPPPAAVERFSETSQSEQASHASRASSVIPAVPLQDRPSFAERQSSDVVVVVTPPAVDEAGAVPAVPVVGKPKPPKSAPPVVSSPLVPKKRTKEEREARRAEKLARKAKKAAAVSKSASADGERPVHGASASVSSAPRVPTLHPSEEAAKLEDEKEKKVKKVKKAKSAKDTKSAKAKKKKDKAGDEETPVKAKKKKKAENE